MEYHGLASLKGVTFYSSAKLELADGRKLIFEAGGCGGVGYAHACIGTEGREGSCGSGWTTICLLFFLSLCT
jgi:hypothetical protein